LDYLTRNLNSEKVRAAQVLRDEFDALAREEVKLSFVASEIFEKYFADENIESFLPGESLEMRLCFDILLDYVLNLRLLINALSSASCGNHSRSVARNSAPEERV